MYRILNFLFNLAEKIGLNYCVSCSKFKPMRHGNFCSLACKTAFEKEVENHFLRNTLEFHKRAAKLMTKRKNFLVVADDEPYYGYVYEIIRKNEIGRGTWTQVDERRFIEAVSTARVALKNMPEIKFRRYGGDG